MLSTKPLSSPTVNMLICYLEYSFKEVELDDDLIPDGLAMKWLNKHSYRPTVQVMISWRPG